MPESYYCHLDNFQILITQLRQAQRNNDLEKVKELQQRIYIFQRQCGVPITDLQLEKLLDINTLDEVDKHFLRTAPSVIIRSLQDGDTEHATLLYKTIKDYLNRNEKHYTIRGYEAFQILSDGNLKSIEPEPTPKIPEPISDAEILLRNMEEDWRTQEFPEICSEQCPHKTCPYHNPKHYGQPCEMRFESKKNPDIPNMKARMTITKNESETVFVNPELKSSLRQ